MIVYIGIHGCDDSTEFEMEVTEAEYEFLKRLSQQSKDTSHYGCMPTLEVEER